MLWEIISLYHRKNTAHARLTGKPFMFSHVILLCSKKGKQISLFLVLREIMIYINPIYVTWSLESEEALVCLHPVCHTLNYTQNMVCWTARNLNKILKIVVMSNGQVVGCYFWDSILTLLYSKYTLKQISCIKSCESAQVIQINWKKNHSEKTEQRVYIPIELHIKLVLLLYCWKPNSES